MMQIFFNNIDIATYGFMPLSIDIPSPSPRLYYVDIAGRNGKLDVTDFMGDVTYQNIDIKLKLESLNDLFVCRNILNTFNGKTITLKVLNKGSGEQFTGRMSNYTCKQNKSTTAIEITLDVNPISEEINEVSNVQD